ncbi:hypothetical protein V1505DRAFT_367805 [Lipomyces doorenjongii]
MCLQDAGTSGVRNTDFVNNYPSGIHVGASWNKFLPTTAAGIWVVNSERRAFKWLWDRWWGLKGGRNWEGPSSDPYLGGAISAATVQGIQGQGVLTSVKVS